MDIEILRAWLKTQRGRLPEIARETGYPYRSLQKFVQGEVTEPKFSRLQALEQYRTQHTPPPSSQ